MFLSSSTRLLSRFILMEILRNVDAKASALIVAEVSVTLALTSRDVPVTSLEPRHGARQRVGVVIRSRAEVAVVSRQSTVEKSSSAAAAATHTRNSVMTQSRQLHRLNADISTAVHLGFRP